MSRSAHAALRTRDVDRLCRGPVNSHLVITAREGSGTPRGFGNTPRSSPDELRRRTHLLRPGCRGQPRLPPAGRRPRPGRAPHAAVLALPLPPPRIPHVGRTPTAVHVGGHVVHRWCVLRIWIGQQTSPRSLTWGFAEERMAGIEPAQEAWESPGLHLRAATARRAAERRPTVRSRSPRGPAGTSTGARRRAARAGLAGRRSVAGRDCRPTAGARRIRRPGTPGR